MSNIVVSIRTLKMTPTVVFVTIFSVCIFHVRSDCLIDRANEELHFSECNAGTVHQLTVTSLTITNLDGTPNYPINFAVPSNIKVVALNNGSEIENLIAKSDQSFNVKAKIGCYWTSFPTFGQLDDFDLCYECPWTDHSRITMEFEVGPYSNTAITLFGGGTYGFNFHLLETTGLSVKELGCIRIEFKTV